MAMSLKKYTHLFSIGILLIFFTVACSSTNSDDTFRNQTGTLSWGGSPVVDGVGMLFKVDDKEYGAPGTPDDYPDFFGEDEYETEVRADFKLTGGETVRGWGATYPAIEFIKIEKIEKNP